MNQKENHNFCCPDEIPASNEDDKFCIPKDCPKRFPTKRFSSPNSGLPPMELEHLQGCIEKLNNILLSISSPRDPANLVPLRNYFNSLRGILIRIYIECTESQENIVGCLQEIGGDYLQLNGVGQKEFVLFSKVCSVERNTSEDCEGGHMHHQELIDIEPCLRRNLVLNFSEVVSSSPELFNIFFGIPLYLRLLDFLNCSVIIKVEGEEELLKGTLICTEKDFIKVKRDENNGEEVNVTDEDIEINDGKEVEENEEDKKIEKINIENICFINVF